MNKENKYQLRLLINNLNKTKSNIETMISNLEKEMKNE